MKPSYYKTTILMLILFCFLYLKSDAGIKWVEIGVNGLTCSLCTRSVERSVSRLSFVDSVAMSLEKTEGRIYVKNGEPINLKAIAKAVVDAGFSVRFLKVAFDFKDISINNNDGSFNCSGQRYVWIEFKNVSVKNSVTLLLVDDDFLPKKESSQWKKKIALLSSSAGQNSLHVVQGL